VGVAIIGTVPEVTQGIQERREVKLSDNSSKTEQFVR
jgi:hypothetical protein